MYTTVIQESNFVCIKLASFTAHNESCVTDLFTVYCKVTIKCLRFFSFISAYELWFKQILFELDSVRNIFISGHVSHFSLVKELIIHYTDKYTNVLKI